jgi:hypothetical protein
MNDEQFKNGRQSAPVENTGNRANSMMIEGFGQPPLLLDTVLSGRDVMALAAYLHAVIEAEREACAQVCDTIARGDPSDDTQASSCAEAIRERSAPAPR